MKGPQDKRQRGLIALNSTLENSAEFYTMKGRYAYVFSFIKDEFMPGSFLLSGSRSSSNQIPRRGIGDPRKRRNLMTLTSMSFFNYRFVTFTLKISPVSSGIKECILLEGRGLWSMM